MGGYSLGDVARICGVRPQRLRYWQRTRLLPPEADRVAEAFDFRDLVCVRRLVSLLEQGVPLTRIRRSVESLRQRAPELARPLGSLELWRGGARVLARQDGRLVESDGQLVLELEQARVGAVAPLFRPDAEGRGNARARAEHWFESGCRLDTDRTTWRRAIEAYERAVACDPDFADAHCNLGAVHWNCGEPERARECFERALEIEPRHLESHLNLGALAEEARQLESALRHYKCALALDPLCSDVHVSLALLYAKLSLPRRAGEHWRRYLQLEPEGGWAEIARRHLDG